MVRPFVGGQFVGMSRLQRKEGAPVVQRDAGAGHDHTGPEVLIHAVDEGAGVALAVHAGDVHCVAAAGHLAVGGGLHGLVRVDEGAPGSGVFLGQQLGCGHWRFRRVSHVSKGIGEGQTHGLDEMVIGLGGLGTHSRHIPAFGDVQRLQRGDALVGRRRLPAGDFSVIGGDGFLPVRGVGRQVLGGHPTALLLDESRRLFRDLPCVEGLGPPFGDGPQGRAQVGQAHNLSLFGSPPVDEQLLARG